MTLARAFDEVLAKEGGVDWSGVAGFLFERGFDRTATAIRTHYRKEQAEGRA